MTYTDAQLKRTLAKMLPEKVKESRVYKARVLLIWTDFTHDRAGHEVLDTELLHLCWLVENSLSIGQRMQMRHHLTDERPLERGYGEKVCHATWQQRTIALAKTKGIEIV